VPSPCPSSVLPTSHLHSATHPLSRACFPIPFGTIGAPWPDAIMLGICKAQDVSPNFIPTSPQSDQPSVIIDQLRDAFPTFPSDIVLHFPLTFLSTVPSSSITIVSIPSTWTFQHGHRRHAITPSLSLTNLLSEIANHGLRLTTQPPRWQGPI